MVKLKETITLTISIVYILLYKLRINCRYLKILLNIHIDILLALHNFGMVYFDIYILISTYKFNKYVIF